MSRGGFVSSGIMLTSGATPNPEITGTPVAIIWAGGANPAAQNVTIPADANFVAMFWSYWENTTGDGLASVTLGGVSPSGTVEIGTTTAGGVATGVAWWINPSTGTQSLDPAWDVGPAEGSTTIVVFVKNAASVRDSDAAHDTSTNPVSVTLTTVSGDLVIKYDQKFGGTAPSLSASWTSGGTTTNNSESARLSYITASGASTVCNSEDEDFSSISAISIAA